VTEFDVVVDRPVAGGRMLARHEDRTVFVAGAIPGERVRVRLERAKGALAWAQVIEVLEADADRRVPEADPSCGGLAYAHIAYARQRQIKSELVADAFRRIGRIAIEAPDVAGSPILGYRLRARLHVRGGQLGFFREGTHDLCDAAPTGQLLPETLPAVRAALQLLGARAKDVDAVDVAENITATERVLHVCPRAGARLDDLARRFTLPEGVTGVTSDVKGRIVTLAGSASVTDSAAELFHGTSPISPLAAWTRRATSFFQGNRFLTGTMLRHVLALAGDLDGLRVVDLYSGVGLFAIACAARGAQVIAVEGDRSSGSDLAANAGPWRTHLRVVHAAVEGAATQIGAEPPDLVIVDPPRTGLSSDALRMLLALGSTRVIYVSCDPATLARDAAKFVAAGYQVGAIAAFDLFPQTPHVEAVVAFTRG
jgi:23S rRNA (uracil1939-C5)-methyltransferase